VPGAVCRTHHLVTVVAQPHRAAAVRGWREGGGSGGGAVRRVGIGLRQNRHELVCPSRIAVALPIVAIAMVFAPRITGRDGTVDSTPCCLAGAGEVGTTPMAGTVVRADGLRTVAPAEAVPAYASVIAAVSSRGPAAHFSVDDWAARVGAVVAGEEWITVAGAVGIAASVQRAVVGAPWQGTRVSHPSSVAHASAVVAAPVAVAVTVTGDRAAVFPCEIIEAVTCAVEALALIAARV